MKSISKAVLQGVCLWFLVSLACGPAQADSDELRQGMAAYENFEYEQALTVLEKGKNKVGLPDADRAKILLYLGLTRFSLGDQTSARSDFEAALRIDRKILPPADTSPKIIKTFLEVKASLPPEKPKLTKKPDPVNTNDKAISINGIKQPAPTKKTKKVWTWVAAGVGVAAMAGAGTCGILAGQAKDDFDQTTWADEAAKYKDQAETRALAANVMYGIGGAALITAVVLFFVEADSSPEAQTQLGMTQAPGGMGATWRF